MRKFNTMAFLIVVMGGALLLAWRLSGEADALGRLLRQASWRDGAATQALDRRVEELAAPAPAVRRVINGVLYAVTGDADPQVRSGCPGWLFLTEELVETPGGEHNLERRVALARKLAADLARRGIAVVSVPVPDKAEQAASGLCGLPVSRQARGRRLAWQQASAGLALRQVDLHDGWVAPGYWRTDTHWNRDGAKFAAHRVAAEALAYVPAGDVAMRLSVAARSGARIGDLTRLAGLAGNVPPFAPRPDLDHDETLDIHHGGGLLDDVAAPTVVLAGSSYSLNSGFADYLQLAMKQEIAQQSRVGSGFAGSAIELLRHHPERLQGVRLLIWEWPLRSLYQPLTDDENAYLAQP